MFYKIVDLQFLKKERERDNFVAFQIFEYFITY